MGRVSDLQWALFQLNISDHSASFMPSKSDFRSAYRNCPISSRHLSLADILIRDPHSGKLHRSGQLAMPFGAVAAVYAGSPERTLLTVVDGVVRYRKGKDEQRIAALVAAAAPGRARMMGPQD